MSRGSRTATQRLRLEYAKLLREPVPYVSAHPLPADILEWHFAVKGPENTPLEGGVYHGKLRFPADFPFSPPSIYLITPNGRFQCNTRLCLSISDYHPESWNPSWSMSSILTGLLSFMVDETPTLGSLDTTVEQKKKLARESLRFNLEDNVFCELFPEVVKETRAALAADAAVKGDCPQVP
ncbi:hypothetical protein MTO96_010514 [Rhipicephalus appendiculatus]